MWLWLDSLITNCLNPDSVLSLQGFPLKIKKGFADFYTGDLSLEKSLLILISTDNDFLPCNARHGGNILLNQSCTEKLISSLFKYTQTESVKLIETLQGFLPVFAEHRSTAPGID